MTKLHQHLSRLAGKRTAILGFAREGQSTYSLLRAALPTQEIWVLDEHLDQVKQKFPQFIDDQYLHFDTSYLKNLAAYDVIFKTPSISAFTPQLDSFQKEGGRLTSQLQEFLSLYRNQTVAVTGTKGKSTTASLLAHLLGCAGKSVVLAGNIGLPLFDHVAKISPDSIVVLETSSFQLEAVTFSPHVAVILNIFPEHLNYHHSFESYVLAKEQIFLHQQPSDITIYNSQISTYFSHLVHCPGKRIEFSPSSWLSLSQKLDSTSFIHLPKVVQEQNILPAVLAAREFTTLSDSQVSLALTSFKTLPHRLEFIGQFHGISFYDDTLATIPEAAVQSLKSLKRVDLVILGGFDRGISYDLIVEQVVSSKVSHVLLFKPSGEVMWKLFHQLGSEGMELPKLKFVNNMSEVVEYVFENLKTGSTVLLSPASPSFGEFKDYVDKSSKFAGAVQAYVQSHQH